MRYEDFQNSPSSRLVRLPQGDWAFSPNPLPPKIDSYESIRNDLDEALLAIGRLDGIGSRLPNPYLLISPLLRKEAVSSSQIEGTESSLSDLFYFESTKEIPSGSPNVREVLNKVQALEYGLKRLKELPVCLRLIRELHEKLMQDIPKERGSKTPGEFRTIPAWIRGNVDRSLNQAIYVAPPPNEMLIALDAFEKFLNNKPGDLNYLIFLAMIHYQFEAIHPFDDGNGRVGRMLIPLLLCKSKILSQPSLSQPFLYLSVYFERKRREYIDLLLEVSQRGAWIEWISFFLKGITEQANETIIKINQLLELKDKYCIQVKKDSRSSTILSIIELLFELPVVTTKFIEIKLEIKNINVKNITVRKNIDKLVELGILDQKKDRRPHFFIAREILEILE